MQPKPEGIESRRYARLDVNLPVVISSPKGISQATMTNVSLGGCQLVGAIPARMGEVLSVSLSLEQRTEEFMLKVVWFVPKETGNSFGSQFWKADEERKRRFLKTIMQYSGKDNPP